MEAQAAAEVAVVATGAGVERVVGAVVRAIVVAAGEAKEGVAPQVVKAVTAVQPGE
jgi:hypothetical protein